MGRYRMSFCLNFATPTGTLTVDKTSLLFLLGHNVKAILHPKHHVVGQGVNPRFGATLTIDAVLQVADLREHINGGELDYQVAAHQ